MSDRSGHGTRVTAFRTTARTVGKAEEKGPREAALDPIGRDELERLLDSFGEGPGLVDVARLRKALDL